MRPTGRNRLFSLKLIWLVIFKLIWSCKTSDLILQFLIQKMLQINLIKLIWPCISGFMNAFIKSYFSYCSLVWMFNSRTLNNKINISWLINIYWLHEKAFRLVYGNRASLSLEDLLRTDQTEYPLKKSTSISNRNL